MGRKSRLYKTREVARRLEREGWIGRPGKGDHRNYRHPEKPGVITLDMGVRELPIGTLRSIHRIAGWER